MGDHHDPIAVCVALYAKVVGSLDTAAGARLPSSASSIKDQLRSLCQQLERLMEQCEGQPTSDTSPVWRELRSAQREFQRLNALLIDSSTHEI